MVGKQSAPAPRSRLGTVAMLAALLGAAYAVGAHEIEFAAIERASAVLGARDEFVVRLSPFDRAARLRSARNVSEEDYLAVARASAREWSDDERVVLTRAFAAIEPKLSELLPELDEPILLIKTSGDEEIGAAAYTRANAIMLNQVMIDERVLQRVLAHEVFHVISRSNPVLKRELYAVIGFEECGEAALPPALVARKLTNPDAPVNEHCIAVRVDGANVWGMPVLIARNERFDPAAGGSPFDHVTLSMLLVERNGAATRPLMRDGAPVLVPLDRAGGLFEQIGRNTSYVIHAEEILATNFERLVMGGAQAPSPEVLERMRAVLARY